MARVDLNLSTTNNRGTWCKWNYEYNNVKTSTNIVKMSDVKKICLKVFFKYRNTRGAFDSFR